MYRIRYYALPAVAEDSEINVSTVLRVTLRSSEGLTQGLRIPYAPSLHKIENVQ